MKGLFKYASLLAAAVMLFACGEKTEDTSVTDKSSKLYILSDKDVIQSNGQDMATLKVYLDGVDVTAESVIYIYNGKNSEVLASEDGRFVAENDGEYKFWAEHGTYLTFSGKVQDAEHFTIKAISVPVPEAVEDTDKGNISFVHRAFLTQYTGIQCGYCPYMIRILKELIADGTISNKAVLVACHSGFNSGDPAKISAPASPADYPYLQVGLSQGFNHEQGSSMLYSYISKEIASDAKAGISINPILYDDGTLVIKTSVKASVDGDYRVGAWLMEDGIYATQSDYNNIGDESYNIHNNCARLIESRYDGSWVGKPLGNIKAGESLEKTFVMYVKNSWKKENLHVALIVSVKQGNKYVVCNAIDCPIDTPTPFEYK